MIVQEISFYKFWDKLQADPYSDYSYEAAEWIYQQLEGWAEASQGLWFLDIPSIRCTFTEVPADEWDEFQENYQVEWFGEVPGGYVVEKY